MLPLDTDAAVRAFLAAGGRITRLPAAHATEGNGDVPKADCEALAQRRERAEAIREAVARHEPGLNAAMAAARWRRAGLS